MKRACKASLFGMTIGGFALILAIGTEPAQGQGTKGTKADPSVVAYQKSLATAIVKLKEAERALLEAGGKEADLSSMNPVVVDRLSRAIQSVNYAYMLTAEAKAIGSPHKSAPTAAKAPGSAGSKAKKK